MASGRYDTIRYAHPLGSAQGSMGVRRSSRRRLGPFEVRGELSEGLLHQGLSKPYPVRQLSARYEQPVMTKGFRSSPIHARNFLERLQGKHLETLTGRPNRILRVVGDSVIV